MHPAFSVILFTTTSGAGYGLLALIGVFAALGLLPVDSEIGTCGLGLGLVLVTIGLLTSTAHLGHPERAWRAVSQWRSSWLSREGLLAIITYAPAGLFFLARTFPDAAAWPDTALALATAVMSVLTVFSTGKIYATLKTIPNWHHGLVVPGYLAVGGLGGALLLGVLAAVFGLMSEALVWLVVVFCVIAGFVKTVYWRSIDAAAGTSTSGTATGLGTAGERVRLLDGPSTSENFVMREMGFRIARKHATKLRQIAVTTLCAVPAVLAFVSLSVNSDGGLIGLTVLALLSGAVGTLVERWLFFAEARHVVTLYYGAEAA